MSRWHLAGVLAVLAVLGGVYWFEYRDSDEVTNPTGNVREPSLADKLRDRPLRKRWAAPVCQPTGVVKLPDGAPARDATVMLQAAPLSRSLSSEPVDTPDVQTAADGTFALPATAAGAWILVAALPRHRAGVRPLTIRSAADCANLVVTLGPSGHAVTGTITDVSGGPIKSALVVARSTATPAGPPVALASTQADGRYAFIVEAGDYAITVRHPQYVGVDGQLAVIAPTTFDGVLTPGAELRGIVLTRDRREPVPGARVTIIGGRASGAMGGVSREVVTGDDGKFAVTGLGSGRAWIGAIGPNHASRDPVEIALGIAESRDDLEVLVDPARRIRGIVTHEGRPAPEAVVAAYLGGDDASGIDMRMEMLAISGSSGELSAETDADGVFELWGLAPGIYEVSASGPHSLPSPSASADVTKADVDGLALELGHGVVIRGRVEPPQVATVTLGGMMMPEASDRWLTASEVKTGEDGAFELHGAEPGETTVYAYTTGGGASGETLVTVGATGASDVVVKLAITGVTVAGRVSDARGKPVAGVYVAGWSSVTGADGRFKAVAIQPGQYSLTVSDSEDSLVVLAPKLPEDTVTVPEGGIADLAITVEARDRTMHGIVIGADGKPAADTWVVAVPAMVGDELDPDLPDLSKLAFDWTGRNKVALTDADGRFSIAGLKAGAYNVAAEGNKGSARGVTRQVTPDRPVRVQLTALGGLTVTAMRAGAPVPRYELEINGPEPDQRTVSSADGRVTLTGIPPGEYTIRAVTAEGAGKATITLGQGVTATATVTIGAWATVSGRIVDKTTGKPLANISAFVHDALLDDNAAGGDLDAPGWITDADGRFTIARVPPGSGEVLIFTGTGEGEKVPFTAGEGARVDVGTVRVEPPPGMDVREPEPIEDADDGSDLVEP
jgi:protocatechuate 3,4-dioxygenase beta subunit